MPFQRPDPRPDISARDLSPMQRNALIKRVVAELNRNPRNVDALLTLAGLQGAEKNLTAATATLLKALAIRKKSPDILRRLVSAANDANDLSAAKKFARKLVEAEPGNAANFRSYGLIVEMMGNPAQAIEIYAKADRLQPGHAPTLHDIGRCHGLRGDHAKAVEFFRKSLDADPHYAFALYNYAVSRKFSREEADALLKDARAALATDAVRRDPAAHANLHYAMGKVLDETGRAEEAFEEFRKANALRDPAPEKPPLLRFVNTFDAFPKDVFAARPPIGHPSSQPVFICGMPRSGTTLTESLCAGHSKVTAGDEQVYMSDIAGLLGSGSDSPGAFARSIAGITRSKALELAERYLASTRHIMGDTPHFTDKLPHNFLNIGLITLLFPNARIILCRRHPLDNCFSLYSNSMSKYHNEYKTELTRLGLYFRQYCQLVDHWKAILPGRFLEVFYEDLVANTELNARAMIDWLGLDWEDGVLDRSGSQRSVRTLSGWQVRQPVYQTSKGKWRSYEKQLAPLIEALGPHVESYDRELAALSGKGAQ